MDNIAEIYRAFCHQIRVHHCLKPLAATCVIASGFSTYIMLRSSKKHEVVWNRWTADRTNMRMLENRAVSWPQVRVHPTSMNKEQYFVDEDKVALLDVIYEDKDYKH